MQNHRDRIIESYAQAWRLLSVASGCEAPEHDGLLTYFSLAESSPFNPTIAVSEPSDPVGALDRRAREYEARNIGFGFETPEGLAPKLEQAALLRGMRMDRDIPAMVLHPIPAFQKDSRIEVRTIDDEDGVAEHIQTQADGFEIPIEPVRTFTPPSLLKISTFFIGYIDGEPAATSIVSISDRDAGIFGVSTKPKFRNHGAGRAVTQAAVAHAADAGCDLAYLHATPMGLPLYTSIGFETIFNYKLYLGF